MVAKSSGGSGRGRERGDGRPPLKKPRREDKAFLGGKEENEGEGTCRDNTFGEKEDRVLSF